MKKKKTKTVPTLTGYFIFMHGHMAHCNKLNVFSGPTRADFWHKTKYCVLIPVISYLTI